MKELPFEAPKIADRRSPIPLASTIINGIPYVKCGCCEVNVRLFEAQNQKISVLAYWESEDIFAFVNGKQVIKTKWIPKLFSAYGCFDCWNLFEKKRAGGKLAFLEKKKIVVKKS